MKPISNSIWIVMTGAILLLSGCEEDNRDRYVSLDFELPVQFEPRKETYKVGDTLSIAIEFPKELADMEGKYSYRFEGFNFCGMYRINQLIDPLFQKADQPGANSSIAIRNLHGGMVPFSDAGGELRYQELEENYKLEVEFVLKRGGVFTIGFGTNTDTFYGFEKKLTIPGKVAQVGNFFYKVNDGEFTNNHLLYEYSATKIDEQAEENRRHKPFFSFKVVD